MVNSIVKIINGIEVRLKKLEENVGSETDEILKFMSSYENMGVTDTLEIYVKNEKNNFRLGISHLGKQILGSNTTEWELVTDSFEPEPS